jgi:DNA processing protein
MKLFLTSAMDKREIIALTLAKELSNRDVLFYIDKFSSINHILNSKLGEKFRSKFEKQNLFSSNNEYFDKADVQLDLAAKHDCEILTIEDKNYPQLLKSISNPPAVLYTKGKLQKPDNVSVSIVGTRKATHYGRLVVERFVRDLVANNVIITSGMAYGIDSSAHTETIKSEGITYSVIASGIDKISTDRAKKLSNLILEKGGCIISSHPMGVSALHPYFIQRNRIISGLSKATIVIESDKKGGSLWTAKFAVEQNRELFAVPGNIFESKCRGTNRLIEKNMAIPALNVDQILTHIGFSEVESKDRSKTIEFNNPKEETIFSILSYEPMHVDDIANKSELSVPEVVTNLLTMEFSSLVKQLPGNLYIRNTN